MFLNLCYSLFIFQSPFYVSQFKWTDINIIWRLTSRPLMKTHFDAIFDLRLKFWNLSSELPPRPLMLLDVHWQPKIKQKFAWVYVVINYNFLSRSKENNFGSNSIYKPLIAWKKSNNFSDRLPNYVKVPNTIPFKFKKNIYKLFHITPKEILTPIL